MPETKYYLVGFDTDRIKDYVFATTDLKKIRGASALLEHLSRENLESHKDEESAKNDESQAKCALQIIMEICKNEAGYSIPEEHYVCRGGNITILLPILSPDNNLADHVIDAVESHYRKTTLDGTITGAYINATQKELDEKFNKLRSRLNAKLREAKDGKGYELTIPLAPYMHPCNSCGRHASIVQDPDEPDQLLCASCSKKREWTNPAKSRFWNELMKLIKDSNGRYDAWLTLDKIREGHKDLDSLGSISSPSGYVGFILADGNRMGSLFNDKIKSFEIYRDFSIQLDQLVRDVTYRALLDVLKHPRQDTAPFEILLVGGDDLMLVVAADAALDVALEITQRFEEEATNLARNTGVELGIDEHLSLSAGVVIAHSDFPIKAMHNLASELLSYAKVASGKKGNIGTVDFMVVTEAATAGLDVERKQVLTHHSFVIKPPPGQEFFLTERPYTIDELKRLLEYVREFKREGFPSSLLQSMYQAMFHSKNQAQATVLGVLKTKHKDLLREFFIKWEIDHPQLPWRTEERGLIHYTPLGDLVEIYPYVSRKERDREHE